MLLILPVLPKWVQWKRWLYWLHFFKHGKQFKNLYVYSSRSFAEKYTEIQWYIDIPIVINLASSNFCLPMTELWTHPQLHFCTFYFALIIFRSHYCFLHNHCIAGLLEEPWNIAQMQSQSEGVWTNYRRMQRKCTINELNLHVQCSFRSQQFAILEHSFAIV